MKPIMRVPALELAGPQSLLTCEEYGFFDRLRMWATVNGGIPDCDEVLRRLGQMFKVSRYKLARLWDAVKGFFSLRDGMWVYEPEDLDGMSELSIKRRRAGLLGAAARWSLRDGKPDGKTDGKTDGKPDFAIQASSSSFIIDNKEKPTTSTTSEAPALPDGKTMANGQTSDSATIQSSSYYEKLTSHCAAIGLPIPDQKFSRDLRNQFPNIEPNQFPKFLDQKSPALWCHKTELAIRTEHERQLKKPNGSEKPKQRGFDIMAGV